MARRLRLILETSRIPTHLNDLKGFTIEYEAVVLNVASINKKTLKNQGQTRLQLNHSELPFVTSILSR